MQKENAKVVVKLVCFPGEFLSGVSRFFVSDGKTSVRSKIGRCRITTFRQNTDFNVGLTPDLHAKQRGFTLIELLVVVLIIGILAAVALPQYQKAVEKSRATQAMTLVKSVYQAADAYYVANGVWPTSFDELSVDIPWTGVARPYYGVDGRSNDEWSLAIENRENYKGIFATRLSGKYKGGQFVIWKQHESSHTPLDTLLCGEQKDGTYAISQVGIYCPKLFQSTQIRDGATRATYTFLQ